MKHIPFSKLAVGYTLFLCSAFLVFCCYEMHRLADLTALAYIGAGVVGLMATALGFYCWRAKAADSFELAKARALAEKEFGMPVGMNQQDAS